MARLGWTALVSTAYLIARHVDREGTTAEPQATRASLVEHEYELTKVSNFPGSSIHVFFLQGVKVSSKVLYKKEVGSAREQVKYHSKHILVMYLRSYSLTLLHVFKKVIYRCG